ncbi:MAG TPA: ABC transporter permease subunit [Vicinamibacteria bacterium]|nr:ABC transporter permease subunit [Vicinamibacteria bacterium]
MPLYDLSYRRFEGPRTSRFRRSFALARSAASLLLRRRSFLLLLAVSWIPAVVRAVQIYVARQFPEAPDFFTITPETWREFLGQQVRFLPVVLVSLATGASAIASDFASGAFTIYLSKPISRFDYVLGKAMPVAGAVSAVTLAPALALLLLQLSLAPDFALLSKAPWLPLAVTAYSLFLALYFTLSVLAVSSLCRSGRVAGAGFAALVFGSEIVARTATSRVFGAPRFLSLNGSAIDAGRWFFGESAAVAPLVVMIGVIALSALVLDRRLRSSEEAQ